MPNNLCDTFTPTTTPEVSTVGFTYILKQGFSNANRSDHKFIIGLGFVEILFPLDGCGGFGGNVVHHTVDAFDLVHNAAADLCQHTFGQA